MHTRAGVCVCVFCTVKLQQEHLWEVLLLLVGRALRGEGAHEEAKVNSIASGPVDGCVTRVGALQDSKPIQPRLCLHPLSDLPVGVIHGEHLQARLAHRVVAAVRDKEFVRSSDLFHRAFADLLTGMAGKDTLSIVRETSQTSRQPQACVQAKRREYIRGQVIEVLVLKAHLLLQLLCRQLLAPACHSTVMHVCVRVGDVLALCALHLSSLAHSLWLAVLT